jgi:hypothetical protein
VTLTSTNISPDESCSAITACYERCSASDLECQQRCFSAGTTPARAAFHALSACASRENCMDPDCAEAKCGDEVTACLMSGHV